MANTKKNQREILDRINGENAGRGEEDAAVVDERKEDIAAFNFVPGRPLPSGFENPPVGEQGHMCIDRQLFYRPEWKQVFIEKVHDKQRNPQPIPGQPSYTIPLEQWVDVPPHVVISLQDAVETHHEQTLRPGMINAGEPVVHRETKRARFHFKNMDSA